MKNGFTVLEGLIVIAIVGIVAAIALGTAGGITNVSAGFNGWTEIRCIGGYQHTVGVGGQARQVLNENGGGVKCQ